MELPKTASDLAIWFGMQFPVLGCAVLLAAWAIKLTGQLHDARLKDVQRGHDQLVAEKDKRSGEQTERIKRLEAELAELRARRSRPRGRPDEPSAGAGGKP